MSDPWSQAEWRKNRHGENWQEIELKDPDETIRRYVNPQGGYFFRNRHGNLINSDRAEMLLSFRPRNLPDDVPTSPHREHDSTAHLGVNYHHESSWEASTRHSNSAGYGIMDNESQDTPPPRRSRELVTGRLAAIHEPVPGDEGFHATQENFLMHETAQSYAGSGRRSFGRSESFNQGRLDRDSSIVPILEADGYRIKHAQFFIPGRVIQTLWYEPHGENLNRHGTQESTSQSPQKPYVTRRPMVVVRSYTAHCLCVPIYTHKQQGANKPNLVRSEIEQHAVIRDEDEEPFCDINEIRKGMPSPDTLNIAVHMVNGKSLDKWSRVRFDSIYTVRYNWKVLEIGTVTNVGRLLQCVRNSLFPT